jgi:putative glutamine amidotransferase
MAENPRPRIAIPAPHSSDHEYVERALPQYEQAVTQAGGEPVRIPLDRPPSEVMKLVESCEGVLLPGSGADVDPSKFGAARSPHTAAADLRRDSVDELLLEDAYKLRKPILGICYGLQSLNVYRSGSLIQHIPDFLPEELRTRVNHEAGKTVPVAHRVEVENGSRLADLVGCKEWEGLTFSLSPGSAGTDGTPALETSRIILPVNSSHHQSAASIGEGLRLAASCVEDGITEALEGTDPDHFVLAVQWHPERSVDLDEPSRAIFEAFVKAAEVRRGNLTSGLRV